MMKFKKHLAVFLSGLFAFNLSANVLAAEPSVTFSDDTLYINGTGSTYTDSDLFDSFKGVMPGDVLSQPITFENKADKYDTVKVYIRAQLNDEAGNPIHENVLAELQNDDRKGELGEIEYMHDFLSQLSMKVVSNGKMLAQAAPHQLGGFQENVLVDTLKKGETTTIDLELTVPASMGNDYSGRIGEVDWIFTVDGYEAEQPEKPGKPGSSASTSTSTHAGLWTSLAAGAALILVFLLAVRKRRSN